MESSPPEEGLGHSIQGGTLLWNSVEAKACSELEEAWANSAAWASEQPPGGPEAPPGGSDCPRGVRVAGWEIEEFRVEARVFRANPCARQLAVPIGTSGLWLHLLPPWAAGVQSCVGVTWDPQSRVTPHEVEGRTWQVLAT